jgi:hypothetical protein
MQALPGSKNIRKDTHDTGAEVGSGKVCLEYRALGVFGFLKKIFSRHEVMGENTAGYGESKHLPDGFGFAIIFKLAEIGYFAPAEKLKAVIGKRIKKTRKGKARAVKIGNADFFGQAFAPADTTEIKGVVLLQIQVQEIKNSETLFGHRHIIIQRT